MIESLLFLNFIVGIGLCLYIGYDIYSEAKEFAHEKEEQENHDSKHP